SDPLRWYDDQNSEPILLLICKLWSQSHQVPKLQYFDPYFIYRLLSPGLLQRLPLRNLHWESHAGPLRSISSLHIDLVPSAHSAPAVIEASSNTLGTHSRARSEDSLAVAEDALRAQSFGHLSEQSELQSGQQKVLMKERRHQIPGLRQTPYLKVFLLRCDDNETYKTHSRRHVRQWIKEHTAPAHNTPKFGAQENYDAFEWMIVHVVIPNTAAANQPRVSGKQTEEPSSEKSGPRWRGGSSSTLLEKLRADFNGSTKSSADRIAQIRIGINDLPFDMIPRAVPVVLKAYTETSQERESGWLDLISKMKSLILASFDIRVTQYEEDIREKDAQRSLPGWNFCTFFVLKEGLARGFESVGLVEDSLVEYDGLAVGLDAIVREQAIFGSGAEHGGTFLPFTSELKCLAESARQNILKDMRLIDEPHISSPIVSQNETLDNRAEIPLNSTKKHYRELILANNISIFDFRCYIFARQLNLLLRLANASSSKEELLSKLQEQRSISLQGLAARSSNPQSWDEVEDLAVLGKVCRRSMEFISSISRTMRSDIWASQNEISKISEVNQATLNSVTLEVIDNIVSSFTFSITQQIIAQSSTKSLPIPPSTLVLPGTGLRSGRQDSKQAIPEPKSMMHPTRSSSLAIRSYSRPSSSHKNSSSGRRASTSEQTTTAPSFLKMGLEELAAQRAELYLLSRSILQRAGARRGWDVGWSEITYLQNNSAVKLEEVDLNQSSEEKPEASHEGAIIPPTCHGIENKLFRTALEDKDDFYRLYETFSDKALRHYTVANRVHSVQARVADLALLKYHRKDYAAAASYFSRMISSQGETIWTNVELSMLAMYAKCLHQLQQKEEYVQVALKLLSKIAAVESENLKCKVTANNKSYNTFYDPVQINGSYLKEIFEITKTRADPISIPLENFFGKVEIEGEIRYHLEMDNFCLKVKLLYLLEDELEIEKVKIKISPISADIGRDIWLEAEGSWVIQKGNFETVVYSNTTIPGIYVASCIILYGSNITHIYDQGTSTLSTTKQDSFFKCPKLLIYQRLEAFNVKLHPSGSMHLDRNRTLDLELMSGWNSVNTGEISIRPATAGLRLQTSETKVVIGSINILPSQEAGIVHFGPLEHHSSVRISVPFTLEKEVDIISIKLDVSYGTDKGNFLLVTTLPLSILLPLGVNVQDFFKHKSLFSKFTISTATSPIRLLGSRLDGSEAFQTEGGSEIDTPSIIFTHQPATILYKITKKKSPKPTGCHKQERVLYLVLKYKCLMEEIEHTITSNLEAALRNNPLHSYTRFVAGHLFHEIQQRFSPNDLEKVALFNEISTSLLIDIEWREKFLGTGYHPKEVAVSLPEFINEWLFQNPVIPLIKPITDDDCLIHSRLIKIPVDVPSVKVVHTAELRLLGLTSPYPGTLVAAATQPISAFLKIKWTRIWDAEQFLGKFESNDDNDNDMTFFFEILDVSDTWIIGGRRRGHFTVPQNNALLLNSEPLSFPVLLFPLRCGYLPYPRVEIKVLASPQAVVSSEDNGMQKISTQSSIDCEVSYTNVAEAIHVVNDARVTTVSLDASVVVQGRDEY
ncbi:Bgt-3350, partial [Blumeria graminis f. sp. tritici]